MNKILAVIIFLVLVAGCVAHVTPEGTFLEPLPNAIVVGPPVVVGEPSHHMALRPLPPVRLVEGRHTYFYDNRYYYYWGEMWYYGERETGPWHRLPREYYPREHRERDRDRDDKHGDYDDRHRDRY